MRTIIPAAPGYRAYLTDDIADCGNLEELDFRDVLAWSIEVVRGNDEKCDRINVMPLTLYINWDDASYKPIIITPTGTVEYGGALKCSSLADFADYIMYVRTKREETNPA